MNAIFRLQADAAEKVRQLLTKPLPTYRCGDEEAAFASGVDQLMVGDCDAFDPWELFPALYGSYSSDFDECAIDVLKEILSGKKVRDDLGAEMLREMLCRAELCGYGTSPRVCFPTSAFLPQLPALIEKWEAYSAVAWGSAA